VSGFSSENNAKETPEGHYKVWAYGQSIICATREEASAAARHAQAWCHDVQVCKGEVQA